jgi:hypothetical protein
MDACVVVEGHAALNACRCLHATLSSKTNNIPQLSGTGLFLGLGIPGLPCQLFGHVFFICSFNQVCGWTFAGTYGCFTRRI